MVNHNYDLPIDFIGNRCVFFKLYKPVDSISNCFQTKSINQS